MFVHCWEREKSAIASDIVRRFRWTTRPRPPAAAVRRPRVQGPREEGLGEMGWEQELRQCCRTTFLLHLQCRTRRMRADIDRRRPRLRVTGRSGPRRRRGIRSSSTRLCLRQRRHLCNHEIRSSLLGLRNGSERGTCPGGIDISPGTATEIGIEIGTRTTTEKETETGRVLAAKGTYRPAVTEIGTARARGVKERARDVRERARDVRETSQEAAIGTGTGKAHGAKETFREIAIGIGIGRVRAATENGTVRRET